jgi:hypothetical protein
MSFGLYLIGLVIVIGGVACGATHWIVVGAIVLLGLAIVMASNQHGKRILAAPESVCPALAT